MAKKKGSLHKVTRGANKGDTVRIVRTKKGAHQQGTPWYPTAVVKDVGQKNRSKVARKKK